jgi:hypothetical protein
MSGMGSCHALHRASRLALPFALASVLLAMPALSQGADLLQPDASSSPLPGASHQPGVSGTPARAPDRRRSRVPDFDGDGFADVAIGAPRASHGRKASGEVHVVYGSVTGLRTSSRQVLSQGRGGLSEELEAGDNFGWSIGCGDFDGDGFGDLAVGSRHEDIGGVLEAGGVVVVHGSAAGLLPGSSRALSQESPGLGEQPERGDQFGWSLVAADFDADGFDDLAVGAHLEDSVARDAGVVHVLRGSADGLTGRRSQRWQQGSSGLAGIPEDMDHFGRTLAAADFDGDGFADLAIGAPYEDRGPDRVGVVHVLHGSRRGLVAAGSQTWSQDTPGILDSSEERDQFGQSLAAGDIDGDGFGDLVVGVWFEDYRNALSNEGGFHVIYGSPDGLLAVDDQFWNEDRPGVLGQARTSERFGQVLTVADFDGNGRDDVAVGTPSTDLGGLHDNQGAIHIFDGSPRGLTAIGDQVLLQGHGGLGERPERDDHFPSGLAAADVDGDGFADLLAGVPWEDRATMDDGLLQVIHGSALGLDPDREQLVDILGAGPDAGNRRGAQFGWSLSGASPHSGVPRTTEPDT